MIDKIINRYKQIRKAAYLKRKYNGKYAFVGIGNHSINNLYPVINHLNVDLKYIVSNSDATAKLVNQQIPHVKGVSDYVQVLKDEEINGVFISASPTAHFHLVKQALEHNKFVFVEKPPCLTLKELNELIQLESVSKAKVLVGLQKPYAPVYRILKSKLKSAVSYRMKYSVGLYPEGDAFTDLFIHPINLCLFLFGDAELTSVLSSSSVQADQTLFLHLKHQSGLIGNVELNTSGWWQNSQEILHVTDRKYEYFVQNMEELIQTQRPKSLLSIPVEKIRKPEIISRVLYRKNGFLPLAEHNEIMSAGYYNELTSFLDMCESKKTNNLTNLSSLKTTFQLIEEIKGKVNV
jgi:virulence factor